MGSGCVRMKSLVDQTCVKAYDITLLQNTMFVRNTMYYFIVYRNTDRSRIAIIMKKVWNTAKASDQLFGDTVPTAWVLAASE